MIEYRGSFRKGLNLPPRTYRWHDKPRQIENRCACGRILSESCKAAMCRECARRQVAAWETQLKVAPKSSHIAGYVPVKGSVAMQFFGRVIPPIRSAIG